MHYLTSNFNLMESNSHWNKLKKKQIIIDKNYNGLIISLKKGNLKNYNFFHLICYVDYSNLNETFGQIKDLIKLAKDNSKKYFFLYLFVNFHENPIQKKLFNNKFLKINFDLKNFYLKTFDQNIAKLFSERNRIHIRFPFDLKFIDFISKEISNNVIYFSSKPYKLIIVDCDNTLWGGILDEDGLENIKYDGDGVGQIFSQFQLFLKNKKKEGFVISVSSKNNEKEVWNAMKNREMILQKKDFIIPRINWEDKAQNIKLIINQLTLRPSDCLFIDDNLLEIEKVKSKIKGLNIIDASNPLNILFKVYSDPRLFKHKILKEDINKYKQYKLKSKFENVSKKNDHSLKFYEKLKQVVIFENIKDKNLDRALQLFNKTNQFNFNLNRYTSISLKKLLKNKSYSIELISFKDKFGDHGIIGAYIIKKEKLMIKIVDFVLSCRVLNRYIEDYIILRILKKHKNKKISINYTKDKVNNVLIPVFLNKKYFELDKIKKNIFKYDIKPLNNGSEIEKIFNS